MKQDKATIKKYLIVQTEGKGRGLPKRLRDKVADAVAELRERLYGKPDCE